MTRAVNYSVLIIVVLAAMVASVYFYNRYSSGLSGNALNAMPASAGLYLKSEIKQGKLSGLTQQPVWKLLQLFVDDRAASALTQLDSLIKNDPVFQGGDSDFYLSVHPVSADRFDFLFLTGIPVANRKETALKILELWSSGTMKTSKRQYEGVTIYECFHESLVFTFCISKNVFIGSRTPFLVEDAIRQQKAATGRLFKLSMLTDAFMKNEKKPSSSLHLHFESAGTLAQVFLEKEFYTSVQAAFIGSATEFKIEEQANHLLLSGFTASEDTLQLAAFLSKQKPVKPTATEILPASTAWFRWMGLENQMVLKSFLTADPVFVKANDEIKRQTGVRPADTLFHFLTGEFITLLLRPASLKYESNRMTIFRLKEPSKAEALLDKWSRLAEPSINILPVETYNRQKIKQSRLRSLQQALTGSWANPASVTYYLVKGNFLIMASSASALRTFIDDNQSGQLLIAQPDYAESKGFFREQSNFLVYYRIAESAYFLKALLNDNYENFYDKNGSIIQPWNALVWQMTGSSSGCETRFALFFNPKNKIASIEMIASEKTDTLLIAGVFPVSVAQESFALVQDEEGQLYKFSSSGTFQWKNLMPGKILSSFFTADIYRNNRQQVVFNTADKLIAIDVDGDFVSNFPITLPAEASGAMIKAPFNQGMREALLIPTVNGRIYAYQPNGRIFGAWNFNYSEPVEFLTHGNFLNQDYVAMYSASGKMLITNANGNILWQSATSYAPAGKIRKIIADTAGRQFVFCTENGAVTCISADGKTETKVLMNEHVNDFLMEDFDYDGSADFLYLTSAQLVIFSQQGRKIFNYDFRKGKIPVQLSAFSAGKSLYVLSHSPEHNLTWVFEKKNGHYAKSPVKGGLPGFIAGMNGDGTIQLVTASTEGFVYFYELN